MNKNLSINCVFKGRFTHVHSLRELENSSSHPPPI